MSNEVDDIYLQVANSKASGGSNLIRDGKYLFEVRNLLLERKHNGLMFIAELITREAEAMDVPAADRNADEIGKELTPNAVGSEVSYIVNFSGKGKDSAPGNVKAFLLAIDGTPEDQIKPEQFAAMMKLACTKGAQPFRGALIRDVTFRKPVKSDPSKKFMGHKWGLVPQTVAEIKTRREALDAGAAK